MALGRVIQIESSDKHFQSSRVLVVRVPHNMFNLLHSCGTAALSSVTRQNMIAGLSRSHHSKTIDRTSLPGSVYSFFFGSANCLLYSICNIHRSLLLYYPSVAAQEYSHIHNNKQSYYKSVSLEPNMSNYILPQQHRDKSSGLKMR